MMLTDEKSQFDPQVQDDAEVVAVTAHFSDPARDGVVDVVSLRGLVRAMKVLRGKSPTSSFDSALVRIINTNGDIAKAIEGE